MEVHIPGLYFFVVLCSCIHYLSLYIVFFCFSVYCFLIMCIMLFDSPSVLASFPISPVQLHWLFCMPCMFLAVWAMLCFPRVSFNSGAATCTACVFLPPPSLCGGVWALRVNVMPNAGDGASLFEVPPLPESLRAWCWWGLCRWRSYMGTING